MPAPGRPASRLRFSKMHGAGNDFIVLDLRHDGAIADRLSNPQDGLCRALSDRRTGVGCDQVMGIEPPRSADAVASYRIWNADGSLAQQCGNGARCVAAWLVREGLGVEAFLLDSPADTHGVRVTDDGRYSIGMGTPLFDADAIPLAGIEAIDDEYAVEVVLPDAGGGRNETIHFGAASMGNPHAVILVHDVDRAPVERVGTALQQHAAFPESVNVGFAQVLSRERIRLRVYERGAGETLACGSGACAAVAVLTRQGHVDGDRGVTVSLPGGELHIHYDRTTGAIRMTGPATFVFEGELQT
ncbi:MAG: diaminopimelate epimerase [Luteimonas sp.]